jgi:hypothetical protein
LFDSLLLGDNPWRILTRSARLAAYDQGRIALAELGEQASDVVAEVRSEMEGDAASSGEASERKRQAAE